METDEFVDYKFDGKYTEAKRDEVFNFLAPVARKYNLICYTRGKHIMIRHRPYQITESLNTLKKALIDLKSVQCKWFSGKNENISRNIIQITPYGMVGDFRVDLTIQSAENLQLFRKFPMKAAHHGISWEEGYEDQHEQYEKVKGNHAVYFGGKVYGVDMDMLDALISVTTERVLSKTGVI